MLSIYCERKKHTKKQCPVFGMPTSKHPSRGTFSQNSLLSWVTGTVQIDRVPVNKNHFINVYTLPINSPLQDPPKCLQGLVLFVFVNLYYRYHRDGCYHSTRQHHYRSVLLGWYVIARGGICVGVETTYHSSNNLPVCHNTCCHKL